MGLIGVEMNSKKKAICQIGPGRDMPGGMSAVIEGYLHSSYLDEFRQIHIVTASSVGKLKCFLGGLARYLKLIMNHEVELAHLHMSERGSCYRAIILILVSKVFKVPVILHSHGSELEIWYRSVLGFNRKIFNYIMKKCDAIIVLTPGWKDFWKKIVKEDRIYVIPNYVTIQAHVNKKYCNCGKINIVFLGYVGDRKGTFDLIRAARILKDRNINFCLRIGGNGEIGKCNMLINELNLQNDVLVLGWLNKDEKEKILNLSDILVLPSLYESFGIVLLEAMAHQLPVICGSNGYSKEIITDGVDGYIAESGNAISIADKVAKLNNQVILNQFGEAAYSKVTKAYSEDCVMRKLISLYKKI